MTVSGGTVMITRVNDPFADDQLAQRLAQIRQPQVSSDLRERVLSGRTIRSGRRVGRTSIVVAVALVVAAGLIGWKAGLSIVFVPTGTVGHSTGPARMMFTTRIDAATATRVLRAEPVLEQGSQTSGMYTTGHGVVVYYGSGPSYIMVTEISTDTLGNKLPVPEGSSRVVIGQTVWWISGSQSDVKTAVAAFGTVRVQVHFDDIRSASAPKTAWIDAVDFLMKLRIGG
jgi:hypothetical protein